MLTDNNPLTYVLKSTNLDTTGHHWLAELLLYWLLHRILTWIEECRCWWTFTQTIGKQFLKIMSNPFVMIYCLKNQAKLELSGSIKFKQLIGGEDRLQMMLFAALASFVGSAKRPPYKMRSFLPEEAKSFVVWVWYACVDRWCYLLKITERRSRSIPTSTSTRIP